MKLKTPRHYCEHCGRKCKINRQLVRYNNTDGSPLYRYFATCPEVIGKNWFQRFFSLESHVYNEFVGGLPFWMDIY